MCNKLWLHYVSQPSSCLFLQLSFCVQNSTIHVPIFFCIFLSWELSERGISLPPSGFKAHETFLYRRPKSRHFVRGWSPDSRIPCQLLAHRSGNLRCHAVLAAEEVNLRSFLARLLNALQKSTICSKNVSTQPFSCGSNLCRLLMESL